MSQVELPERGIPRRDLHMKLKKYFHTYRKKGTKEGWPKGEVGLRCSHDKGFRKS